jgi:trigger factor
MNISTKNLPKSEIEITVEISAEEMKPYLAKAAERLSTDHAIEGFRPGKAPLDVVAKKFGDAALMEAAAEEAVRATYGKTVIEKKLSVIGSPAVSVKKLAKDNPFVYTATAPLLPETKLVDLGSISVVKKEVKVPESELARAKADLREMRAKETAVGRAAAKADKIVIDMDMKLAGVPLEGGQAKNHAVYTAEEHYIPGFSGELIGLKKGDTKNFTLTFPKEHFQKHVAGKPVEFSVKVNEVFERQLPEWNDELAQGLGQKTAADLDKILNDNLLAEAESKENQRVEIAAVEEIVKRSKFGDIPDLLVNEEIGKMIHELRHGLEDRGMDWKQYLEKAGKTENQVKLDFAAQAVDRIKAALVCRAIAEAENIDASAEEVAAEVEREMNLNSENAEAQAQIRTPEYAERVQFVLKNRKVIAFIKEKVVK